MVRFVAVSAVNDSASLSLRNIVIVLVCPRSALRRPLLLYGRFCAADSHRCCFAQVSFEYTPNNPTGFHKLDLSEAAQRDICLRMVEIKNEVQDREAQLMDFYNSGKRAGGRREGPEDSPEMERVWRYSRLDGATFGYREGWKVPRSGILEVDFVQIMKPSVDDLPPPKADMSPQQAFQAFLDTLQAPDVDERRRIALVRRYSNTELFTCQQLAAVLALFQDPDLRVEVCVIGFARTLDWHGYRNVVLALSLRELKILYQRIGYINLFDDVMAVDFYELDLERAPERFVMQELLHLASVEPGDNMVECTYQGIDFTVPAGWLKEVPRTGVIILYYCREQATIEKIFRTGSWDSSGSPFHTREDGTEFGPSSWSTFTPRWLQQYCEKNPEYGPVPCSQPRETAWARPYKLRRIKAKMRDKFADPHKMFKAMDRDGGGSLDRKELAMGLFALGVWLAPTELQVAISAPEPSMIP